MFKDGHCPHYQCKNPEGVMGDGPLSELPNEENACMLHFSFAQALCCEAG